MAVTTTPVDRRPEDSAEDPARPLVPVGAGARIAVFAVALVLVLAGGWTAGRVAAPLVPAPDLPVPVLPAPSVLGGPGNPAPGDPAAPVLPGHGHPG